MKKALTAIVFATILFFFNGSMVGIDSLSGGIHTAHAASETCGAYVAPGVWKQFDCYNLAAIGKTTNDDPFTPSWRLIGGYWQWGRNGPDPSQWYNTNTEHFAHGPTGPDNEKANSGEISGWDQTTAPDGSWTKGSQAVYYLLDQEADLHKRDGDGDGETDLLLNINTNGIRFRVDDGPELIISFDKGLLLATAEAYQTGKVITHADFVAALQPGLAQLIDDGSVPADTTLYLDSNQTRSTFLDDGSRSSDIPAMVLGTQTDNILDPVGFNWVEDLWGEYNIYGGLDQSVNKDPCPKGFRVPTQSQWQGVIDNNPQSTVGTWDFDTINYSSGRFLGNDLMLPAAGSRGSYSGSLPHRGFDGAYWSSSEYSDDSAYAGNLVFFSDTIEFYGSGRLQGKSVRCIADSEYSSPCTHSISSNSGDFASNGESITVSVSSSGSDCAWTTSNDLPWVSLSPTSGTGSGTVTLSVTANTGAARSGSITIAGQSYSVIQAGKPDQVAVILTKTSPDHTITSGSDVQMYGTSSSNQITLESGAHAELINFPGYNSVQVQSSADLFTVSRSGTVVIFEGSDNTILKIPATTFVQTITFSDRAPLTLSLYEGQVMLDDQVVNIEQATIDSGTQYEPVLWRCPSAMKIT